MKLKLQFPENKSIRNHLFIQNVLIFYSFKQLSIFLFHILPDLLLVTGNANPTPSLSTSVLYFFFLLLLI